MEVSDINQDLDKAENNLVEELYNVIYLTEGKYPVTCTANRKESSEEIQSAEWR